MKPPVKIYYTLILPPLPNPPDYYSAENGVKVGSFSSRKEAEEFMREKKLSAYPHEIRQITIPE